MNHSEEKWYIWSIEHSGWWKPKRLGYTQHISDAGTYSYEEALKIVKDANIGKHDVPNEAMIKL
jgi:hypothetical protein